MSATNNSAIGGHPSPLTTAHQQFAHSVGDPTAVPDSPRDDLLSDPIDGSGRGLYFDDVAPPSKCSRFRPYLAPTLVALAGVVFVVMSQLVTNNSWAEWPCLALGAVAICASLYGFYYQAGKQHGGKMLAIALTLGILATFYLQGFSINPTSVMACTAVAGIALFAALERKENMGYILGATALLLGAEIAYFGNTSWGFDLNTTITTAALGGGALLIASLYQYYQNRHKDHSFALTWLGGAMALAAFVVLHGQDQALLAAETQVQWLGIMGIYYMMKTKNHANALKSALYFAIALAGFDVGITTDGIGSNIALMAATPFLGLGLHAMTTRRDGKNYLSGLCAALTTSLLIAETVVLGHKHLNFDANDYFYTALGGGTLLLASLMKWAKQRDEWARDQ